MLRRRCETLAPAGKYIRIPDSKYVLEPQIRTVDNRNARYSQDSGVPPMYRARQPFAQVKAAIYL